MSENRDGEPSPLVGEGREGGRSEQSAPPNAAPYSNGPPPPTPSPQGEGGSAPLPARKRLPWEQGAAGTHPGFRAAAFIYLAACLIMWGVSAFMFFGRSFAWTDVPVFAPALAGFYFLVRFMMMVRPRIQK